MQRPNYSFSYASLPPQSTPQQQPPPSFSIYRGSQAERPASSSRHRPITFTTAADTGRLSSSVHPTPLRPSSGGALHGSLREAAGTTAIPTAAAADHGATLSSPWARRSTDPPRVAPAHTTYNSSRYTTTGAASTVLPTLPRQCPTTRLTASAPRAVSQPTSFTTPLRPAPPTVQPDTWGRRGVAVDWSPRSCSSPGAAGAVSAAGSCGVPPPPPPPPPSGQPAMTPAPVQLVLCDLSVRDLRLPIEAADAVGPVLLRGMLGDDASAFCKEESWQVEEEGQHWGEQEGEYSRSNGYSQHQASWPGAVVSGVVENTISTLQLSGTTDTSVPSFLCECWMLPSPTHPQLCIGRTEVAVDALLESAGTHHQQGPSVEIALRDETGVVVGRLCGSLMLLPLPRRTVRLRGVMVQPDPLLANGDYGDRRRTNTPAGPSLEGELAIALSVPPAPHAFSSASPSSCATASRSAMVEADLRSSATARWTSLPPFTFIDGSGGAVGGEGSEGVSGQRFSGPAAPPPQPLVMGELLYCPAAVPRGDNRALVLLGTFAVPPPSSPPPANGVAAAAQTLTYSFHVPLRTSAAGARWMAMGDCWVRGVAETWVEAGEVVAETHCVAPVRSRADPTAPPSHPYSMDKSSERRGGQEPSTEMTKAAPALAPPPPQAAAAAHASQRLPSTPPPEDIAMQRVRERQAALLQRVEYRLEEVRQQRAQLQAELATHDAAATAEEDAIVEEFALLEAQQLEAETAHHEATVHLAELQQLQAEQRAEQNAYMAEQAQALEEVAHERAEAVELRAQLEALQVQMRAHMAAEQQRYADRVERTRTAIGRVEANTRWLTEVEARIAAAECEPLGEAVRSRSR